MNLAKLFETQKVLRDRIAYNEPDRFNKLVLALLVELSECANEWRGFKYWSDKQEPKYGYNALIDCHICQGRGFWFSGNRVLCGKCNETGKLTNPLLEEYVDGLHFVLEIGLEIAEEIQFDVSDYFKEITDEINGGSHRDKKITDQFNYIFYLTTTVIFDFHFPYLFAAYYQLGEMLGFTWEEIEQAYFAKNAINHERQDNGY